MRRCSTCGPWSMLLRVLTYSTYCVVPAPAVAVSDGVAHRPWEAATPFPFHHPVTRTPCNQGTERGSHSSAVTHPLSRRRLPSTPTYREHAFPIPRRRHRLGTTRGPGRSPAVACIKPGYLFQRRRRPNYLHSCLSSAAAEPTLCYCAPMTRAGMYAPVDGRS